MNTVWTEGVNAVIDNYENVEVLNVNDVNVDDATDFARNQDDIVEISKGGIISTKTQILVKEAASNLKLRLKRIPRVPS